MLHETYLVFMSFPRFVLRSQISVLLLMFRTFHEFQNSPFQLHELQL